jgi:hypothetical protein
MISSSKIVDVVEEPISINILIPRYRLKTFSVLPSTSIGEFKTALPNSDLIFNGQILNDAHTIAFYNIQQNASLVAIPTQPHPNDAAKWIKLTLDTDTFDDSIRSMLNRSSRKETLRLQDLRAAKLESRPRSFRKFCHDWMRYDFVPRTEEAQTVVPSRSNEPSEEALPVCW